MPALPPNVPQYLFDDTWIDRQQHLVRRWLPATVYPWPVIEPDQPWEDRILAFHGTVLPDPEGGYRAYYNNWAAGLAPENILMARSRDGFRWEKPCLGLIESHGTFENNITLAGDQRIDSPSLIYDPEDLERPWKLIVFQKCGTGWTDGWGLYGYVSADGLRWQPLPGPLLRAGDRTNMMADKVDGKYVVYTRDPNMMEQYGARAVYRSESDDFREWSELEPMVAPDLDDEPGVEIYGMSVFQRNGWFLGLVEYWDAATDVLTTHLAISRDGRHWIRPTPRRPLIGPAHDWNRTWSSCASNGPTIIREQMVFHFGGRWVSHHYDAAQQAGVIGYASLPVDRFCAIEAAAGGRFDTPAFTWPGGELALNADTRQSFSSHPAYCNGRIRVHVLDAESRPLPDWSGQRAAVFRGNTHCRARFNDPLVRWPDQRPLAELAGRPVRLRFELEHARLFTIAAVEPI